MLAGRRQLEDALARYHSCFDGAPAGYLLLDAIGIIEQIDRAGAALLDSPRGRLVGEPFGRWVVPDDRELFGRHLADLAGGDGRRIQELRIGTAAAGRCTSASTARARSRTRSSMPRPMSPGMLQLGQIPWSKEAQFRLPVCVWQAMMQHYYLDGAWLLVDREVGRIDPPLDRLPRGEPPSTPVETLESDGEQHLAWQEALEREVVVADLLGR